MILFNPTSSVVSIVIDGTKLSIEPQAESRSLSDHQVKQWLSVHAFLEVRQSTQKVVELKKEVVEEVKEEQEPEVVEESKKVVKKK